MQLQTPLHSLVTPVEYAFAPDIKEAKEEQSKEDQHLDESHPPQSANSHRERIEKRHLDVEEQEDHRAEVELDRMALARIAHGRHAALIRGEFFGSGLMRPDEMGDDDIEGAEPRPEADHNKDRHPAVHVWS